MKAKIILSIIVFIFSSSVFCQKSFLDSLQSRSEIIAHIKVHKITGSGDWDLGATEVQINAEVLDLYKGAVDAANKINFTVISHTEVFDRLETGKDYIVFLNKADWFPNTVDKSKLPYTLADFWLGIQPYTKMLHNKLHLKY